MRRKHSLSVLVAIAMLSTTALPIAAQTSIYGYGGATSGYTIETNKAGAKRKNSTESKGKTVKPLGVQPILNNFQDGITANSPPNGIGKYGGSTAGKTNTPTVTTRCLQPGSARPSRC
jgi:hypothetical protein